MDDDIACAICEHFDTTKTTTYEYHTGTDQPPQTEYVEQDFLTTATTIFNAIMNSTAEHLTPTIHHNWTSLFTDQFNNTDLNLLDINSTESTQEFDVVYYNSTTTTTVADFFNTTMSTFMNGSNMSVFCDHVVNMGNCNFIAPPDDDPFPFSKIFYTQVLPQVIIAVLAIFLNLAEIYLMKKRKKYYPSEYLMVSLAFADLMFSVFVLVTHCVSSLTYHSDGSGRRTVLEIVDTLIAFSIFASIAHVVAISLDRLVAVIFPLRHRVRTDAIKMKRVVIGIWCVTVIFIGSLSAYQYRKGIGSEEEEDVIPSHTPIPSNTTIPPHTTVPSHTTNRVVSILMLISAALVALIYLVITHRLAIQVNFLNSLHSKRHRSHHTTTQQNRPRSRRNRIETVALLTAAVVTVAFLACTLPYACYQVIDYVSETFDTLSLCLLICNSVCNPLVYFWRGYWLKSKRRKNTITITRMASKSKSKEDSSHQNTLTSLAQSVGVAFVPIRTNMAGMRKSKNKKYNLSEVTVMDIFDFDSISRFKRIERSYYNQGRQFEEPAQK